MKYFWITVRFIISLIVFGANFAVNGVVCAMLEPRLQYFIDSPFLVGLASVGIFFYVIFQMGLLVYLMAQSMIRGCKKHKIKYS